MRKTIEHLADPLEWAGWYGRHSVSGRPGPTWLETRKPHGLACGARDRSRRAPCGATAFAWLAEPKLTLRLFKRERRL